MRRSPVQGLIKLGSISEIVCYVARSNHAKFHAFITKVNNSAIFWTLAAGLHVPWTEILKFFKLPTLIFCSFLDKVEIIVNEIYF